ncbi:MAG: site-specific DNA-methyltransferase, partial [Acidobacteria bacterium]|nr:site-specific DNA-methyltransferase [Acidobacteriota bacterium]
MEGGLDREPAGCCGADLRRHGRTGGLVSAKKKATRATKPLLAYTHAEAKRANLPTDQTERYMREEELAAVPYTPERRASEGPRLSWRRGKSLDELTTNAGPLYVHEKVSPTAFAEQLRGEPAPTLFDEFNGLPPDAAWSCYTHRGNWSNRLIKGHSEDVMASLAGKEDLAGKVQMIYWDPPYGIKFDASFQPNTRKRAGGTPSEAAPAKAFRDTYRDGIHSYLDAVYRTAAFGRELLTESGSFFLQISSENLHRCSLVLDEVFGPENRVATIAFKKSGSTSANTLPEVNDWLLWYSPAKERLKFRQLYEALTRSEKIKAMNWDAMVLLPDGARRAPTVAEREDPDNHLPVGARVYQRRPLDSQGESRTGRSESFTWRGREYPCPATRHWSVSMEGMERLAELGRLDAAKEDSPLRWMRFEDEFAGVKIDNLWHRQMKPDDMHYVVETAESVIERCILMATDPGDLILDPTCGSGTTALVAERWGRRWITIDASAVPVALARQRILTGVHDWFLTKDDLEGWQAEVDLSGSEGSAGARPDSTASHDPASGFVHERLPHVSAEILAYDLPQTPTLLVDRPRKKKGWKRLAAPFTVESHSPWRYEPLAGGAEESELRAGVRERMLESLGNAGFVANLTNVGGGGRRVGGAMKARLGPMHPISSPTKPGAARLATAW